MKVLLGLTIWALLFVICWPAAIIVLIMWPVIWVLSIPFRIVGIVVDASLALIKSILFLPSRLLGHKTHT